MTEARVLVLLGLAMIVCGFVLVDHFPYNLPLNLVGGGLVGWYWTRAVS